MLMTYECLQILKAQGLTQEKIADVLRVTSRTISRFQANPCRESSNESAFIEALADQGQFPFAKEWIRLLSKFWKLREERMRSEIKERYGLLFSFVSAALERGDEMGSEARNGALYFCAHYALEVMKDSSEKISERREQAERYFGQFAAEMGKLNTMVGDTFAAKAVANIVVSRWNACSVTQRNGDEMQTYIDTVGYFDWLSRQIKHYPNMETPRFNRLGIASGLRRRGFYKEFYDSLCEINSKYKDPKIFDTSKPEFNDFVDFRAWLDEQQQKSSRLSSVSLVVTVALLIAAIFTGLNGDVSDKTQLDNSLAHAVAAIDIRPHEMGMVLVADLRPHTWT